MWLRTARWTALIAFVAAIAALAYRLGTGRPSVLESEAVLRRALQSVAFAQADTLLTLVAPQPLVDSLALPLRGNCGLRFVDAFPYDNASYLAFFTRPALVWQVDCEPGVLVEAEVRKGKTGWQVLLRTVRAGSNRPASWAPSRENSPAT